ncbi:glycine betaine ABC transporter substrate-binding protein [Natranaerobius thermophilus]|uniref:Substrate-binding region of ABC-type glycine betaine transport system n=1 Tax=Natranaerobius thermophilus (strain ATCC BAA-1301 / DSM 18059 / JW/NM-WN-LF) TaxID=457570 RepID=B2A4L9_NATTJ|nr:glycine betaine ABC transporter substrate-binding protein [Natranaerobius thermophilus]ACB85194.1 Substrate-binding region of ABC-type glycine betaine transport system [Natranaerobius thermophilus JW/NM-WN-LF]
MSKKLILVLATVFLVGTIGLAGCDEPAQDGDPEGTQEEIELAYVNWACAEAQTHVAQEVIESELGYDVEITMADAGPIWADVAAGNQDGMVCAWLPVTQGEYDDEYDGDVDNLGPVYEGARIGLVVPEYVDIDSIEEMDEIADELDNEIVGIEPGAGIMINTDEALEEYDSLAEFELIDSSDAGMTTSLSDAVDNEEPIVVTGWTPHWKFAEWDLEFLEDPLNVYGEEEHIAAVARQGLEDDAPDVYEFLDNYIMDDDQIGEVMGMIEETDDPEASAEEWVEENQDVVQEWLD